MSTVTFTSRHEGGNTHFAKGPFGFRMDITEFLDFVAGEINTDEVDVVEYTFRTERSLTPNGFDTVVHSVTLDLGDSR